MEENKMKPIYYPEPFRITAVEPLKMLTRAEREKKLAEAKNIMLFRNAGRFCSPGAAPYSRTRGTRAKPKGFPGGPGGDISH